jgi:hypothetical protein
MNYSIVKYSEIEERNGVLFLFDSSRFGIACRRLEELDNAYHGIRQMLADNDYPITERWIKAVAEKGAEGLHEVLVEDSEHEAKRLKVPRQVAEQWKRTAIQDVEADVWGRCDRLNWDVERLTEGLPPLSFGFSKDDGILIDLESAREAIKALCSYEVTDEVKAQAETIIALARQVREMEMAGINCTELVGKYARRDDIAPGLEIYADIATRRHSPATISSTGMADVFNRVAQMKPLF